MVDLVANPEHFSNAGQLVAGVLTLVFGQEPFISLVNSRKSSADNNRPRFCAEMLARRQDGKSAGFYFDQARVHGCVVEADIINFEKAVKTHLELGIPVSINLNAETFFSPQLFSKIKELLATYPDFNPKDICLEITEQGGVPSSFHEDALVALKDIGFSLALDDYDPRQAAEQSRLTKFGPHLDIVKFPFQVLEVIRNGSLREAESLGQTVKTIKGEYSNIKSFVMEGVRDSDDDLLSTLKEIGIDLIQLTSYVGETSPVHTQKVAFPEVPFRLALAD